METAEYDPLAERNVKHPTTYLETLIHLVKGALGAGIFAMPFAFKHIGLWTGLAFSIVVSYICTYGVHMVVRISQDLCVRQRVPQLSLADVAERCFYIEDVKPTRWGTFWRIVTEIFIILFTLGCVCIYFVNASKIIKQVVDVYSPDLKWSVSIWILILAVPLVFLCLIRSFKFLAPFSLIANVLIFVSFIITCTFIFTDLPSPSEREGVVTNFEEWPTFFAIEIFALEGMPVVMPLENEMKEPRKFTGCPSVLMYAMVIVSFLYTFVGFFGYLKFGDEVEANVTLNIPIENVWAQAAKIMVAMAVFLSILLYLVMPTGVIWVYLVKYIPEKYHCVCNCGLKIVLLLFCCGIAALLPDLGPFISLNGAVTLSILGLVEPGVFHIAAYCKNRGFGFLKYHLIIDIALIILGVLTLVFGTFESIRDFHSV